LDEEEKKEKIKHWVHPIWMIQDTEEFSTLYRGLVDHECKFYEYFRLSQNEFCDLRVKKYITKKNTYWRRAISARKRLVCLR
jgi:hypothetical protein